MKEPWYKRPLTSKQLWLISLVCLLIANLIPFIGFGALIFPFVAIFTWRKERKIRKTYKATI